MLPIVNVIEAAMALKIELFSTKLETELNEPLSDLKIFERRVKTADVWRLAVNDCVVSQPGVIMSLLAETVVCVTVTAAVLPEYCHTIKYSTLKKTGIANEPCGAVV
jgi:hypothetical protein